MRFYGVGIYNLPRRILYVLQRAMPALQAEESLQYAKGNRVSTWANDKIWLQYYRAQINAARPQTDEPALAIIDSQHAGWFEANGIPYQLAGPGD